MSKNSSIEVEWLEEVDSTSRLAREHLAANPCNVAAFAARRQTAGVGRLGRGWQSCEGNLHLSIAIPGEFIPEQLRDILPLWCGIVIAEWLERSAGIRPVLKWPNDLVIDGKKIGGILCEATVTGGVWNGVVIGVGLNLVESPKLGEANEYQAGSVLASTGVRLVARLVAEALVRRITEQGWSMLRSVVLSHYRKYATAPGQLWSDKTGRWWRQEEIDDSGSLALVAIADGRKQTVTSSDHGFRWSGLYREREQILVADIGNSRVKIGTVGRVSRGFKVWSSFSWASDENVSKVQAYIDEALRSKELAPVLHVTSVNPTSTEILQKELKGIEIRELRRAFSRSSSSRYDLGQIGMDRLAAVEAVLALRGWGVVSGPLFVVSAGTATTIDVIDSSGLHDGGFIGIGAATALKTLHGATGLLPKVDVGGSTPWSRIPSGTEEAMVSGTIRMQAAWLDREMQEWSLARGVAFEDCTLVLTGGNADAIAPLLLSYSDRDAKNQVRIEPNLVLLGTALLAASVG